MKFYNDNLDFTGNKYNNPYALIQQAGKKTRRKKSNKRSKNNKSRRNKSRRNKK